MKFISVLIVFAFALTASADRTIQLLNKCSYTIWPGMAIMDTPPILGLRLDPNDSKVVQFPDFLFSFIWPRTKCDESGHCETGNCANETGYKTCVIESPVTLVQFLLNWYQKDYYDVLLYGGYNVPVAVYTVPDPKQSNGPVSCPTAGCNGDDLNAHCPNELAVRDSNGTTIACKSACEAFGTEPYCCYFASQQSCHPDKWPVNYAAFFMKYCPRAIYFESDPTNHFNCTTSPQNNFVVQFCPSN